MGDPERLNGQYALDDPLTVPHQHIRVKSQTMRAFGELFSTLFPVALKQEKHRFSTKSKVEDTILDALRDKPEK